MNYGSFYGGRKGTPFVIVKNYPDIISMVDDFRAGPNFSEVKYDQYVLINTVNKSHPDNGKIFRRGYDYSSGRTISGHRAYRDAAHTDQIINGTEQDYQSAYYDVDQNINAGGAQYIGTIVGPPGRAPHLTMMPYTELKNKEAQEGYSVLSREGVFSLPTEDLLPGKYVENDTVKYNDEIKWYTVSIKNINNDESDAYVGFKIPYPVIDFTTEKISPYDEQGFVIDSSKTERIDSGEYHPFYEKWKIYIPEGVKGDALKKLRVVRFQDLPDTKIFINELNYYYYSEEQSRFFYGTEGLETDDTVVETTNDKFSFQIGNLTYTIQPNTQIMVYDLYNYEYEKNPQDPEKIYFVGILNQIMQDTFDIADNGDIHIDFTDGTVLDKKGYIKKIDNIQIGPETDDDGVIRTKMKIYFNTQDSNGQKEIVSYNLKLIDNIDIANNGTIRIDYTDGSSLQKAEYLKAIQRIVFQNNELIITLNTGEQIRHPMSWVSDFQIDSNGDVKVKHNGNSTVDETPIQKIRWINSIGYDKDSNSTRIIYNTGEETSFDNVFRSITSAFIDADQNLFVVQYNTTDEQGNPERDVFELAGSLISSVSFNNEEGTFSVNYTGKQSDTFSINYPAKVEFKNSSPNDDCILKIDALDNTNIFTSDTPIDSIYDVQITSDHHLVVLFTSTITRDKISEEGKSYPGSLVSPRDGKSYSNWLDLGSVFTDSGILIGLNLNHTDFGYEDSEAGRTSFADLPISDVIERLNSMYPEGVDDNDYLRGKIVTVGVPNIKKEFYAFDYSYNTQGNFKGWYFLGSIESAARGQIDCGMGTESEMSSYLNKISDDGLFFIVEG